MKNEGVTYGYGYTDSGDQRTTTVTDPNGNTKVYVGSKTTFLLKSVEDELHRTTLYTFDQDNGHLDRVEYPQHNKVDYTYDTRGNVTKTKYISRLSASDAIVTTAEFDSGCANTKTCNKPNMTTDARGKVTDYTYDATHGSVTAVTLPAPTADAVRPQTNYRYAAFHAYYKNSAGAIVASPQSVYRLTKVYACTTRSSCAGASVLADQVKTEIGYGPQAAGTSNNLLPVTESSGSGDDVLIATTSSTWDAIGNRTYVNGPLAGSADTTRTLYDADREVVGVIGPDPDGTGVLKNRAVRLTYNNDGQVTLTEQGTTAGQTDANWAGFTSLQQAVTAYDPNARVASQRAKAGAKTYALTQYSYDTLGRPDCSAVRMNESLWNTLPASACTNQTAGDFGPDRVSKTEYTAASELLRTSTGIHTPASAVDAEFSYTGNGLIETAKDGNGNLTTYGYDGFDRLEKTRYPSPTTAGQSSATDYEQLTYDDSSRVTARRLRDGTSITYSYDDLGRLKSKFRPLPTTNRNLSYAYDNLGRPLTATGSLPTSLSYTWDALGRLTSETDAAAGGVISHLYDLMGRETRQTWETGNIWAGYARLVTGEVIEVSRNGGDKLATYDYDDLGRRAMLTRTNGVTTAWGYDTGSRLTSLRHTFPADTGSSVYTTFVYNPAGQIASKTRNRDSYAETPRASGATPYAINGLNQTTKAGSGSGATTIGHDARGNVTSIGTANYSYGADNLMQSAPGGTLVYDALDRLYRIDAEDVRLRYNLGGEITSEHDDATGAVKQRYIHGAGIDEPLVRFIGAGVSSKRWLIADERGSIIAEADGTGERTQLNTYDEYGVPGSGNAGRFQYTGQAWVPSIGMYYYKNRVYNPDGGWFMQTDPIGYGGGMNLYGYVGGDPINGSDPSGLIDKHDATGPLPPKCTDSCTSNPAYTGSRLPNVIAAGNFGFGAFGGGLPSNVSAAQLGFRNDDLIPYVSDGNSTVYILPNGIPVTNAAPPPPGLPSMGGGPFAYAEGYAKGGFPFYAVRENGSGGTDTVSFTRAQALTSAKLINGVPYSFQPLKSYSSGTYEGNRIGLDTRNIRYYIFRSSTGSYVGIREDRRTEFQPPHFNSGLSGFSLRNPSHDLNNHSYFGL